MPLRRKLVKLAYQNKALRPHLLPLIKTADARSKALRQRAQALSSLSKVTLQAELGKPWRVYLSLIKGSAAKFWEAYGASKEEPVTIRWGRIGSKGQELEKDWGYFEKTVRGKLKKGYTFSSPQDDEKKLALPGEFKALKTKPTHGRIDFYKELPTDLSEVVKRFGRPIRKLIAFARWKANPDDGMDRYVSTMSWWFEHASGGFVQLTDIQTEEAFLEKSKERTFEIYAPNPQVGKAFVDWFSGL